jgi:hypothetical protein
VGFYALNRFVVLMVLDAVDIGGAQTVHLFGTLFGTPFPTGTSSSTSH